MESFILQMMKARNDRVYGPGYVKGLAALRRANNDLVKLLANVKANRTLS